MKRKKRWLRWIAWTLLLVLCMNSAGTTVLAVSVEEENIPNINSTQEGELHTEESILRKVHHCRKRRRKKKILRHQKRLLERNHPAIRRDSGGRNYSIPGRVFRRRKSR